MHQTYLDEDPFMALCVFVPGGGAREYSTRLPADRTGYLRCLPQRGWLLLGGPKLINDVLLDNDIG